MAIIAPQPAPLYKRSDWIRLRTFIVLRWIAIVGQVGAISVAIQFFDLQLNLGLCFAAIGISIIANLIAMSVFPENKRLTENQVMGMFLFDAFQLSILLFLTGGLQNPFSLLLLVPVAISASVLRLLNTIILGLVTISLTSIMALYYLPLQTRSGDILEIPQLFIFGFWVAILIGTVFLGVYERRVTTEVHAMSEALLATQMALSREQKLTDLGGVVAATAHELGTPLATIKLVSTELIDELSNMPALQDDAKLIGSQADRCRDILHSMGRIGKDDLHLRYAPISSVLEEAAEPHINRGKSVHISVATKSSTPSEQPEIRRQPEIIHGLRNLIQNAVDFADSEVWIDADWTDKEIKIKITDNGDGFPSHILGRIGDPFVSFRKSDAEIAKRPGYAGMGLGLFIAKTLLERSGAEISFANACDPFLSKDERPARCGAIIKLCWVSSSISHDKSNIRQALGENQQIDI